MSVHPAVAAAAILVLATTLGCDEVKKSAEMKAAEAIGDLATERLASMGETERAASDLINIPIEVRQLSDVVWQVRGVANTQLIETSQGNVIFDTGLATQAAKQRRLLGEAVPGVITHVILSHSHQDHVGGVQFWEEEGTEIIAHQEYPEEQRYLKELEPYLWHRNRTLFPFMPEEPPDIGFLEYGNVVPTVLVDDGHPLRFEQGGIRFEVLPTPGAEGADNLCLWLPDQKILLSGDFFGPLFPQFPNVFTMRGEKIRKPIEYIRSLDALIELGPEMVIPGHNDPIEGAEGIRVSLIKIRDAVQYVHDAVVAGMNAGRTVHELMAEITLPPELELSQVHGRVSWAVKSIWEYYATWFHFDTTTQLYPVPASSVFREVAELAGADALVAKANAHIEAGRPVAGLHLLEFVLADGNDHQAGLEARRQALEDLLEEAKSTLNNSYEVDWLRYRLRDTAVRIEAVGS
ncbi:MAG: MBL fold metallo-hydrolase [bacterium]|nr:MBL fold metallo-hydrolase [bacterium]